MASWWLSSALVKLRSQINAIYPNRDKSSDGSIGDTAHAARVSDHNPRANGEVCAIDITVDKSMNLPALLGDIIKDSRVSYVISNRKIWTPKQGWHAYTGSNPHDKHFHVSVKPMMADAPWALPGHATTITPSTPNVSTPSTSAPATDPKKTIEIAPKRLDLRASQNAPVGKAVKLLQALLWIHGFLALSNDIDGYGKEKTRKALRQFQVAKKLNPDDIAGDRTWAALLDVGV